MMDPLHLVWLSSILGALLFSWLGWSLASLRVRSSTTLLDKSPELQAQLEQLRANQTRVAAELEETRQRANQLSSEAEAARSEARRSAGELAAANSARAAAEQAEASFRSQLAAMERSEPSPTAASQELLRVQKELERAREQASAASTRAREIEQKMQTGASRSASLEQETAKLRADVSKGAERVTQLVRDLEKARSELNDLRGQAQRVIGLERDHVLLTRQSKECDARAATLEQRCRELDQSAGELRAGLATARSDIEELTTRLRESQQRAAGLNSRLEVLTRELEEARTEAARAAELAAGSGRRAPQSKGSDDAVGEIGELRFRLATLQAREAEAERTRQEAAHLREQLAEHADLKEKARLFEALSGEYRRLRVDHSMMVERAASLERTVAQHGDSERRVRELELEAKEAARLRERLAELEPLALAQATPASKRGPAILHSQASRDVFAELRRKDAFRSAAVADAQGLLVHGDGMAEHWESLSAFGGLASRFAETIGTLLPIGKINLIHLYGTHDAVLSCWLTGTQAEPIVMAALGIGAPIGEDAWLQVANPVAERETA